MTLFEIIILIIIYSVCYGYTLAMCVKEENVWFRILLAILSFVFAIYAPLQIGVMLYEKLEIK